VIDLSGKRALVTGGSRGIGAATARLLAQAGADVMIGYRSRRDDAERVVGELQAHGVRAGAHASQCGAGALETAATTAGASLISQRIGAAGAECVSAPMAISAAPASA